jgi:hypothetical protein
VRIQNLMRHSKKQKDLAPMKTQKTTNLLPLPALALLSAALLSACGPESDFENAINVALEDRKKCWNISSSQPVTFPITVQRGFGSSETLHPILAGLETQGMIELEKVTTKFLPSDKISLTSEGERRDVWTDGEGFCIGTPEVVEIVRFTYGDDGRNENVADVEFTYRYTNVPSWLDRNVFAKIPGMVEPDEDYVTVQKSSDGWHAPGWF